MCAGCTSIRPRTPWCGAWTRSRACRPSPGSTPPNRPSPASPVRREFEYKRHGTAVLFAGLDVHDGGVAGWVDRLDPLGELRRLLGRSRRPDPTGLDLHCIVDNLKTHDTDLVHDFLADTRMCTCTSRRPTPAGSTRSSCSSRSSSADCCAGASSTRSITSPSGSSPSSRTTTAGRRRSAGPTTAARYGPRKSQ